MFLIGVAMGALINLLTADTSSWPAALRPAADHPAWFAATLVAGVGGYALWLRFSRRLPKAVWTGGNPYPGLEPYQGDRAAVFFGRGDEIGALLARCLDARRVTRRFVPVVGPSGSGKSSLVTAGLLPVLAAKPSWKVLGPVIPGIDTFEALAACLPAATGSLAARLRSEAEEVRDSAAAPTEFVRLLGQVCDRGKVLLFVDQLEETVTHQRDDDRHAFLALVRAALERCPGLCVIATLRTEFLGHFQHGPGADMFTDPFMVNTLDPPRLREVVTRPVSLAGLSYEDGLADMIVAEAHTGDALPMISYLLHELVAICDGKTISHALYERLGGLNGAIATRANSILTELSAELQDTLPPGDDAREYVLRTLLSFVAWEGNEPVRRRVSRAELDAVEQGVVDRFVDARLIVSNADATGSILDLAHEALVRQWKPLADVAAVEHERLRWRTELEPLARAWHDSGRRADYLVAGSRLADGLRWRNDPAGSMLPPLVADFLDASLAAEREETVRRADTSAGHALDLLQEDPETAILIAAEVVRSLAPTQRARYALYAGLGSGLREAHRLSSPVEALAWSPDGTRLAVGLADGRLRLVGPGGEPHWEIQAHDRRISAVTWSPDGGRIASSSEDHTARTWDGQGNPVTELRGHRDWVGRAAWSPDGRSLATASGDRTVRIWTADGTFVREISGHLHWVRWVDWSPDGTRIATASGDRTAGVWSLDGERLLTLPTDNAVVWTVAWSPDGTRVAAAAADRLVRVWSSEGGGPLKFAGHRDSVWSVCWSPDGQRLTSCSGDARMHVWSAAGDLLHETAHLGATIRTVSWQPGEPGLIATGLEDGRLLVWETGRAAIHRVALAEPSHNLAWSPDGQLLTAGGDDGIIRFWSVFGEPVRELKGHGDTVWWTAWSPDGARLASASDDRTVRIWAADGRETAVLARHGDAVRSVAWSPDSQVLASGAMDHTVCLWRADGVFVRQFVAHDNWVNQVAWSPDGGLLATASRDGTAKLWTADGNPIRTLVGHEAPVTAVAWAPHGTVMATGGDDGSVRLWDPRTGELRRVIEVTHWVGRIVWAPDGSLLAFGGGDRAVHVMTREGEPVIDLSGHRDVIWAIAWHPAGDLLATGSDDRSIIMWPARFHTGRLLDRCAGLRLRRLAPRERRLALLPPEPGQSPPAASARSLLDVPGH